MKSKNDRRLTFETDPFAAWDTHRTLLSLAIKKAAPGSPVLELGTGFGSTRQMHALCAELGHPLVSYENDIHFYNYFKRFDGVDGHSVIYMPGYGDPPPIEDRHWGVALVDSSPGWARPRDIKRLADRCDVLVIHDTSTDPIGDGGEQAYGTIWHLFKYRVDCWMTTAVSNFIDVREWRGYKLGKDAPSVFCNVCVENENACVDGCEGPVVE